MAFYKSISSVPDDSEVRDGDQLLHSRWVWEYREGRWRGLHSVDPVGVGLDVHLLVYRGVSVVMSLPKEVSDLIVDPSKVHDEDLGIWGMMYPELLQEYKDLWVQEYSKQAAPTIFDKYKEF